jgi:hypothetical protein
MPVACGPVGNSWVDIKIVVVSVHRRLVVDWSPVLVRGERVVVLFARAYLKSRMCGSGSWTS